MRWLAEPVTWQRQRVLVRFLLLPKCIGGEWRWLEWAGWIEHHHGPTELCEHGWWEAQEWTDRNPAAPTPSETKP